MSTGQNPITTTRFSKEAPLIFDLEGTFHMGTPCPNPDRPSSTRPEATSSHHEFDICTARLGPPPSRSPTPEIDLVPPIRPERRTELLDSKIGFFLTNNAYISHWECCKCHTVHKITDKNKNWKDMKDPFLARSRDAKILNPENCANLDRTDVRCDLCFDLDLIGYRRRHCNKDYCEREKTPLWLELKISGSNFQKVGSRSIGKVGVEECHKFTGQEGATEKEEFPVPSQREFPREPW